MATKLGSLMSEVAAEDTGHQLKIMVLSLVAAMWCSLQQEDGKEKPLGGNTENINTLRQFETIK